MDIHERNILFRLSSISPEKNTTEFISKNRSGLNWNGILDGSSVLGSLLLVYNNLVRLGLWNDIDVAKEKKETFKNLYFLVLAQEVYKLQNFIDITKRLNAIGITPMPLKALSLNIDTYSRPGIRRSNDIDILIEKEDMPQSLKVLKALGCHELDDKRNGVSTNFGQEVVIKKDKWIYIDLHYRLIPWHEESHIYKIDSLDILKRAKEIVFEGCKIRKMDKNDEILYLAISCARNYYRTFAYYADIDAIIKTHTPLLDWAYLYKKSLSMKFLDRLNQIFYFLSQNLGTPVSFQKKIKRPKKAFDTNFLTQKNKFNKRAFYLLESPTVKDKLALLIIYLKWRCFKRMGLFKSYFRRKNSYS